MLRDEHVAADMTLTVYEGLFRGRPGEPAPVFARYAAHLPPAMLRQVSPGPLPTPPDLTVAAYRDAYAKALTLTRLLRRGGVQLVAGTDFAPLAGLAFPRELELMVEAGLTPAESLRVATIEAAQVMKLDAEFGSVDTGKVADLILVAGDPTRHIEQIRDVRLVIKGGVAYRPEALLNASGLK
jgi:imidazolonepropionase-like amidohydrolase